MRVATGTFNGTGAVLHVCIGFIPDEVVVWDVEGTNVSEIRWNINQIASAITHGGVLYHTAAGWVAVNLLGAAGATGGIVPYKGGETMTAYASTHIHRVKDSEWNQCYNSSTGYTITKWTAEAGVYTGSFDYAYNATYVGEGSRILIDGIWYGIISITSPGTTATNVTLAPQYYQGSLRSAPTGRIGCITPMYEWATGSGSEVNFPLVTKDGFSILLTSIANVAGEICVFKAWQY